MNLLEMIPQLTLNNLARIDDGLFHAQFLCLCGWHACLIFIMLLCLIAYCCMQWLSLMRNRVHLGSVFVIQMDSKMPVNVLMLMLNFVFQSGEGDLECMLANGTRSTSNSAIFMSLSSLPKLGASEVVTSLDGCEK